MTEDSNESHPWARFLAAGVLAMLPIVLAATTATAAVFYCDPEQGRRRGDGSAADPWRTVEEVLAARRIRLVAADGSCANPDAPVGPGDTLLLRSGWHGVLHLATGFNAQPITIAAEEGHRPRIGSIEIREGSRWVLRGLTVSPSLAPQPSDKHPGDLVVLAERGSDESAELVVEDCFIYSVLDASAWTADDWIHKPANGIRLGRHGRGHVARNNYVYNTRFGINLCAVGCLCEGNVVSCFSADGIRAMRDGQTVQHNVIKNNFVSDEEGDSNHDDGIQMFLFNAGKGTVSDIAIRGNLIMAREDDHLPFPNPLQGIGGFDGPLVNILIEQNVVAASNWHGIALYDAQQCTIRNNACFSRWNTRPRPWIMLGRKREDPHGNIVRDNRAHSFDFKADPTVEVSSNLVVTPTEFRARFEELAIQIEGKFGKLHVAAGRPRLETPAEEAN